jgi:hypothetical protein
MPFIYDNRSGWERALANLSATGEGLERIRGQRGRQRHEDEQLKLERERLGLEKQRQGLFQREGEERLAGLREQNREAPQRFEEDLAASRAQREQQAAQAEREKQAYDERRNAIEEEARVRRADILGETGATGRGMMQGRPGGMLDAPGFQEIASQLKDPRALALLRESMQRSTLQAGSQALQKRLADTMAYFTSHGADAQDPRVQGLGTILDLLQSSEEISPQQLNAAEEHFLGLLHEQSARASRIKVHDLSAAQADQMLTEVRAVLTKNGLDAAMSAQLEIADGMVEAFKINPDADPDKLLESLRLVLKTSPTGTTKKTDYAEQVAKDRKDLFLESYRKTGDVDIARQEADKGLEFIYPEIKSIRDAKRARARVQEAQPRDAEIQASRMDREPGAPATQGETAVKAKSIGQVQGALKNAVDVITAAREKGTPPDELQRQLVEVFRKAGVEPKDLSPGQRQMILEALKPKKPKREGVKPSEVIPTYPSPPGG